MAPALGEVTIPINVQNVVLDCGFCGHRVDPRDGRPLAVQVRSTISEGAIASTAWVYHRNEAN